MPERGIMTPKQYKIQIVEDEKEVAEILQMLTESLGSDLRLQARTLFILQVR